MTRSWLVALAAVAIGCDGHLHELYFMPNKQSLALERC